MSATGDAGETPRFTTPHEALVQDVARALVPHMPPTTGDGDSVDAMTLARVAVDAYTDHQEAHMSAQNEVQASPPNPVDVEKQRAYQHIRQGEQRGVTLQIIRDFKIAEAARRWRGVGVDVPEGHGRPPVDHDWISTGDPCWCGSDNCAVCLVCGEENHD